MAPEQLLAQRCHALGGGLDDQQLLRVVRHAAFPPVHGVDGRDDVHAGRESCLDERVREPPRVEVRAGGGEHEGEAFHANQFILVSLLKRIALFVLLALLAWLAWEWIAFPDVKKLAKEPPKTTAFIEQRKRELRKQGKSADIEWTWVAYGRISPSLRRAVLVAEDNEFYEHQGVDTKAMREAFERNWKRGRITHAGSTITQQLAKNLFLSGSRSYLRKGQELIITYVCGEFGFAFFTERDLNGTSVFVGLEQLQDCLVQPL